MQCVLSLGCLDHQRGKASLFGKADFLLLLFLLRELCRKLLCLRSCLCFIRDAVRYQPVVFSLIKLFNKALCSGFTCRQIICSCQNAAHQAAGESACYKGGPGTFQEILRSFCSCALLVQTCQHVVLYILVVFRLFPKDELIANEVSEICRNFLGALYQRLTPNRFQKRLCIRRRNTKFFKYFHISKRELFCCGFHRPARYCSQSSLSCADVLISIQLHEGIICCSPCRQSERSDLSKSKTVAYGRSTERFCRAQAHARKKAGYLLSPGCNSIFLSSEQVLHCPGHSLLIVLLFKSISQVNAMYLFPSNELLCYVNRPRNT